MICFIIVKKDVMIKKILLWLWITFLSFIGFSSAIDLSKTFQNWSYNNIVSNIDVAVYNRWMLASNRLWNVKRMIAFWSNSTSNNLIQRKYFWWNNWLPYFYFYYSNWSTTKKWSWIFKRYYLCDVITSASSSSTSISNCNSDERWDWSFASDFFNSITASDYWGYKNNSNSSSAFSICFSSASYWKSVCFEAFDDNSSDFFISVSMDSNIDYIDFPNSLLWDPPWRSTSGWWNWWDNWWWSSSLTVWITPWTVDSALNYYEKYYWWDSSICYAWVNSLSYLYWQNWVSYHEWNGLSIFDIYYQLYWTWDSKEDMLLYSSRWLNSWLINYHERFDTSWNPSWLAYYNSWTHLVDYQFDNLGFPFANQPVAFYFLADNIQWQTEQITQWEEVVSYCNIKINSWTYDEIIWSANKYNINSYTEQWNTNVWLNPDWTKHEYTGAFLWSWVNLAFSWNVSIKNTLKNFFDELNKSINIVWNVTTSSILPNWLFVAFLTVVLFKFLRKRN